MIGNIDIGGSSSPSRNRVENGRVLEECTGVRIVLIDFPAAVIPIGIQNDHVKNLPADGIMEIVTQECSARRLLITAKDVPDSRMVGIGPFAGQRCQIVMIR
jgi:hypothetical protein